jgi:dephospho-CoA kinase
VTGEKPAAARAIVVGIIGAVASGKSAVARLMQQEGAVLIDADAIAHDVLERPDIKQKLKREFGMAVFAPDGSVDRKRLGSMVFDEPEAQKLRERLNAIVHPPILKEIDDRLSRAREKLAKDGGVVALDAPLLIETGLDAQCDALVYVDVPDEVRRDRAMSKRGWNAKELARRDAAQTDAAVKRTKAHFVVQNAGSMEQLRDTVSNVVNQIKSHFGR